MGDSKLADIPGNAFYAEMGSYASRASNVNATVQSNLGKGLGPFRQAIELLSADVFMIGGTKASAATAGANTLQLVNAGSDGSGTTVLASLLLNASLASETPYALTMVGTPSVAADEVILASVASGSAGGTMNTSGITLAYKLT